MDDLAWLAAASGMGCGRGPGGPPGGPAHERCRACRPCVGPGRRPPACAGSRPGRPGAGPGAGRGRRRPGRPARRPGRVHRLRTARHRHQPGLQRRGPGRPGRPDRRRARPGRGPRRAALRRVQRRLPATACSGSAGLDRDPRAWPPACCPGGPRGTASRPTAEVQLCLPFLLRHLQLLQPRRIVLFGGLVARTLLPPARPQATAASGNP